jgi:hypothetical protein
VLGFIGGTSDKPAPISEKEAQTILQRVQEGVDKPRPKVLYEPGEMVRVTEGPFNDFEGVVEEVNYEKSRLRVGVMIFGRTTPVELEFSQVEKVSADRSPAAGRLILPSDYFGMDHSGSRKALRTRQEQRWQRKSLHTSNCRSRPPRLIPVLPSDPALGQHGVNIMEFCKTFNAQTQHLEPGLPIPVVITVYSDRSFTFIMKTPPASVLLRKDRWVSPRAALIPTPRKSAP